MLSIFTLLGSINGATLANLLLHITAVALVALTAGFFFRGSPVSRYGVLYSGMLMLPFVLISSLLFQFNQQSLLSIGLDELSSSTAAGNSSTFIIESFPLLLNLDDLWFDFSLLNPTESLLGEGVSSTSGEITMTLTALLIILWCIGFGLALLGLVRSQVKLKRILGSATSLAMNQERAVRAALKTISGQEINVQFAICYGIASPILVGIKNPTIYFPKNLTDQLSAKQLCGVLLHELAHLQRKDIVANYGQKVTLALFWFHPLVHMMDKIIDRSREEICDNYVLAKTDSVSYGEALLLIGIASTKLNASTYGGGKFALGIAGQQWRLEDRIKDLINPNRETSMNLSKTASYCIQCSMFIAALLISACQVGDPASVASAANDVSTEPNPLISNPSESAEARYIMTQSTAQSEPRDPPPPRTSQVLSDAVLVLIQELQPLLTGDPEDDNYADNRIRAKEILDQLTLDEFDTLNDFEKATSLNFLTNYYLLQKDYPNAVTTFERILAIDELQPEIRLRALKSLGQLASALEQWQGSINYYTRWRDLAAEENELVYRGMSYAHYQLDELSPAISYWESYMSLIGKDELSRDDYVYLNGMYYQTNELEKSLELTKEMILTFNDTRDWNNLRSIYTQLDREEQRDEAIKELQTTISSQTIRPDMGLMDNFSSNNYLPLVARSPQYPIEAANAGIEGWVLVEFTVGADGYVDKETLRVIDSDPLTTFDRVSLEAAAEFYFKPRVENGEAIKVEGVQYLFRFELEEDV